MSKQSVARRRALPEHWYWIGGFAAVAALIILLGLSQRALIRPDDEGLYVRIAQEMYQRRDLTVPTWFGAPAWYKPPLFYWSMFPWFALLGPGLLAGRLAAATWSGLALASTVAFGWRARDMKTGIISGAVLLTCASFYKYSRVGMLEAPLIFFCVATLYSLYRAQQGDGPRWIALTLALVGASTLVKGPVTLIILGLTTLLYCLALGQWGFWRSRATLLGGAIGLLGVGLWPLMVAVRGQWASWWSFFIVRENVGKFDNIHYSPFNIWGMFLVHMAPWTFVFLVALAYVLWHRSSRTPAILLNLIFMGVLLTFFTLPATRMTWYSVPALPQAALLVALVWQEAVVPSRAAAWLTAALLWVVGICLLIAPRAFNVGASLAPVWLSALAALGASVVLVVGRRWGVSLALVGVVYIGLGWLGLTWPYYFISPEGRAALGPGHPAYVVRLSPYAWSFEIGQLATQVVSPIDMKQALEDGGRVLVTQSDLREFQRFLPPYKVDAAWSILMRNLDADTIADAFQGGNSTLTQEAMAVVELDRSVHTSP